MTPRTMEVVFLTSFTDGCFRAIPAVAQMADDLAMRLTLLHAFDPQKERHAAAEVKLASFFPEADRFTDTRRIVCEGPVMAAVKAYTERRRVDLFVAPGVDRLRPLRVRSSTRALLVEQCEAPVWTIGSRVGAANVRRPTRRIACWLDPESTDLAYLRLAAELSRRLAGELDILYVVPEIHEGELSGPKAPLRAEEVAETVTRQLGGDAVPLSVHVSPGGRAGAVLDLVRDCDPDLLVLSPRCSVRRGLFGARVSAVVDRVACPVLCVGVQAAVPRVLPGRRLEDLVAQAARLATSE